MRLAACLVGVAVLAGCAAHRAPAAAQDGTLETFVEKVRQLSSVARPPAPNQADTLEHRDPELAAARLLVSVVPSGANHRLVAEAYARNGVLDLAYDHFAAATRLDPRDAAAFDGLARIWRDWKAPHLGLADAYRAIYFAPTSPVPLNTLGTLLLDMGRRSAARAEFERARALDPRAPYVWNNLCYVDLLEGNQARAREECLMAIQEQPEFTAAHNNLALVYAALGDMTGAAHEFSLAGSLASARFNMGVALMATRHFDAAAQAFGEAATASTSPGQARARARQARKMAATPVAEPDDDAAR